MTAPNFSKCIRHGYLGWVALCLLLSAGCQNGMYAPRDLPMELRASDPIGVRSLDLSRLAQPAEESDVVYVGDVLDVTVATGLESREPFTWTLRVAENGTVNIPLVQQVRIAGMELTQAENMIRQTSIDRGIYRNPHVSVILNQRRMNRITVMGAVEEPAVYELPAESSDLLAAIVAAGGLTEEAGTIVEIRRPASVERRAGLDEQGNIMPASYSPYATANLTSEARIDLASLATSPDLGVSNQDLQLEDGSVVMIGELDPESIQVLGLVREPDRFELPANEEVRLLDAIAMAGGRTMELANDVQVIRQSPETGEQIRIAIDVREAKKDPAANLRLMAGDVVSVEETPLTFTIDTLQKFIRFGFSSTVPGL